jgi:LysM repeat protein
MVKKAIKSIATVLISAAALTSPALAADINHTVKSGDTFWIISQKYGVDLNRLMAANGANEYTVLYVGQNVKVPVNSNQGSGTYTVQRGDTFWIISQKLGVSIQQLMQANGANEYTVLYPGNVLKLSTATSKATNLPDPKPWITYTSYTVQKGDDLWKLGLKFGVPMNEIVQANKLNPNAGLYIGQKLTIPVHHVPVHPTPDSRHGELLDWWTEAQYVWPIGKDAVLVDYYTGQSWKVRRTVGANHADVEPLTANDAAVMKKVWGGSWSWVSRPVILKVDGREIAASASAMPHDIEYITNNNFSGHFDVHFYNSTRHVDGKTDSNHQKNIRIAAGR